MTKQVQISLTQNQIKALRLLLRATWISAVVERIAEADRLPLAQGITALVMASDNYHMIDEALQTCAEGGGKAGASLVPMKIVDEIYNLLAKLVEVPLDGSSRLPDLLQINGTMESAAQAKTEILREIEGLRLAFKSQALEQKVMEKAPAEGFFNMTMPTLKQ